MTRRLTLTIGAVVVATLLLVGVGTLAVAAVRSRAVTTSELRDQARELADGIGASLTAGLDPSASEADTAQAVRRRFGLVRRFASVMELDDLAVLVVRPNDELVGELPTVVGPDDLDLAGLRAGEITSGRAGRQVWAAAATTADPLGRAALVVVTRRIDTGLGAALGWFVVAAVITLTAGVGAAVVLGRRLARPVIGAGRVATAIAGGDLSARLPDEDGDDELAELARSLNAMAAALQRSRAVEQEFLQSISHDLRTPLTSIRGYAEAVVDGAAPPAQAAGVIVREARRLERLVGDLLELARAGSTGFVIRPQRLDVDRSAADAVDAFRTVATELGVELRARTDRPATALVDPDRLGQVLANLIENALTFARTSVDVTVATADGHVVVTVADDGPGVDPTDLPFVFDRLYAARRAPARQPQGSGLGLAIVRELAVAMGGTVVVAARPGTGAAFTVRLPAAPAAGAPVPSGPAAGAAPIDAGSPG